MKEFALTHFVPRIPLSREGSLSLRGILHLCDLLSSSTSKELPVDNWYKFVVLITHCMYSTFPSHDQDWEASSISVFFSPSASIVLPAETWYQVSAVATRFTEHFTLKHHCWIIERHDWFQRRGHKLFLFSMEYLLWRYSLTIDSEIAPWDDLDSHDGFPISVVA